MHTFSDSNRGISPILATLLLIVIVVAASIAAYSWVQSSTASQLNTASGFIIIENVRFYDTNHLELTIRNTGTSDVKIDTIYIDNLGQSIDQKIQTKQSKTVTLLYSWSTGTKYKIKVVSTTGLYAEGLYSTPSTSGSAKVWYDPSWSKRKTVTIDNTLNPNNLTNYQVILNVQYDSDMKADFSDLRITDSDQLTLIPYWIQSYVTSDSAKVWVNVPFISASSTKTICIYYGNIGATSVSDGYSTFPVLFNDFEGDSLPEGWQVDGDTFGTMSIEDSLLKLTGEAGSSGIWKQRGVKTSSPVWENDQALMYRVDSINYYPENNRHLWYLGGEATNYYVEFYSYEDKINVRDYNIIDYYSPTNWVGTEVVWLAKESGNSGNAYYYLNGELVDVIDGTGLHATHQFPALSVYFKARQGAMTIPNIDYVYVDWVAIRKFEYPEPTHGGWGEEESF
jgi:flagellin-like protein